MKRTLSQLGNTDSPSPKRRKINDFFASETDATDTHIQLPPCTVKARKNGPRPQIVDVPRFSLDSNEFATDGIQFIKDFGFAVVRDVLTPEQVQSAQTLAWNFLEGMGTGIDRNDVETWENDNWPQWRNSGVVAFHGIGQSEFLWYLRGIPSVKKVFSTFYNTNELLTSFDGAGIFRPWQHNAKWKTKRSWLHIDQNPAFHPDFECLQGLVTLYDADEETGGFMCIPKSHLEFKKFYNRYKDDEKMKGAFTNEIALIKCPTTDVLYQTGAKWVPRVRAGDMVLWDSRLMHCNTSALVKPEFRIKPRLLRLVGYVCMTPTAELIRKKGQEYFNEFVQKRENAVANLNTSNHMPFAYKINPAEPRMGWLRTKVKAKDVVWGDGFVLSEEQTKLIRGA